MLSTPICFPSLFITVAIIGILAAVAIPSYNIYIETARVAAAYSATLSVQNRVSDYVIQNQEWPTSMQDPGLENASIVNKSNNYEGDIYDDGIVGTSIGMTENGEEKYIVIEPEIVEGDLIWTCYGKNTLDSYLPPECKLDT